MISLHIGDFHKESGLLYMLEIKWPPPIMHDLLSHAKVAQTPIYLKIVPNWPSWHSCLAGSSKTAPRILIFSITMGADYSLYLKSIATCAPTFFGYHTRAIITCSLYIFYLLFGSQKHFFKEVFSENSSLMYG